MVKDLIAFFGGNVALSSITPEQAESFKTAYMERGHAAATIHRQVKFARQFFGIAVKQKLITTNPFIDVKAKNHTPTDRLEYIPCQTIHKIIEHASPTWRIILALARFAGLRCQTEVCSLRWEHVNLAEGRMTVSSPKTEHLEGKA